MLTFGWVLGAHAEDPNLFKPTLSYFSNLGAFLGGVGTIGLLIISIRTISSWKEQHKHQHRFNSIMKILDAYDELSIEFDEYWVMLILDSSNIKAVENLGRMESNFDDRLKAKRVRWRNFSFESIFSNMDILFENEEIEKLRRASEVVKGIMDSKVSNIFGGQPQFYSTQFSQFYPRPSQNMQDVKDLIKRVKQEAGSMVKHS
jgi:hypothetical protein